MNKEVQFAKILKEVKELGRSQGNMLQEAQVIEAFEPLNLSSEQLQMVYDYLLQNKIGLGMPLNAEEFLSDEEKSYLDIYLEELADLEQLSQGEREAVLIQAMAGEERAKERVIQAFLPDVVDIAKLYAGQGAFLEDLIGEGNLALITGVELVGSQETPAEASGMLVNLIMEAMELYLEENAAAKARDEKLAKKVNEVAKKARELGEELHRKVSVEELAKETKLSQKAIRDAFRLSGYQIEDIEE